jgi:hypothetical protein
MAQVVLVEHVVAVVVLEVVREAQVVQVVSCFSGQKDTNQ